MKLAPFEIPPTVTIRRRVWRILRECDLDTSKLGGNNARRGLKGNHGRAYLDLREIHLAEHSSPRAEASTFLHELMHACSHQTTPMKHEEGFILDIERSLLDALASLRWRKLK